MDFSPESLNGQTVKYFDSGESSKIQILFVPGVVNPEVWKHQLRYFSKNYRTLSFRNDSKNYKDQREAVNHIVETKNVDNLVLVSSGLSNSIAQEFEAQNNIVATVMAGVNPGYEDISRSFYDILRFTAFRKPKLAGKLFFSEKTGYRITKDFLKDFETPEYQVVSSFLRNYRIRRPMKDSLVIHAEDDRFSSKDFARSMRPEARVSLIKSAGSFSFYEKPEEYNKAMQDFLKSIEEFVESKQVRETREKNRSLEEFAKDRPKHEKPVLWE